MQESLLKEHLLVQRKSEDDCVEQFCSSDCKDAEPHGQKDRRKITELMPGNTIELWRGSSNSWAKGVIVETLGQALYTIRFEDDEVPAKYYLPHCRIRNIVYEKSTTKDEMLPWGEDSKRESGIARRRLQSG